MDATTFRTMTVEHLGDSAMPQDLALFQSACLILMDERAVDEATATEMVWNDGDWFTTACQIVGAPGYERAADARQEPS